MNQNTSSAGGSKTLNDKKQQELYVKRCNDVFESMSKTGYKDVILNIMEARMKDTIELNKDESTDTANSEDSTGSQKKKEPTLLIAGLPYKKMPFEPYINLLKTNPELYTERSVKGKDKDDRNIDNNDKFKDEGQQK